MIDIDHTCTDEVVCPWCGHVHGDSWEWFREGKQTIRAECESCEKEFIASIEYKYEYYTAKIEIKELEG